jgi:DNA repair exonuclease SbcCD ATPase subunit
MRRHLFLVVCAGYLTAPAAFADATTETQLRAALQAATTQIAQLEDQVANLQASQAPDVAMIEALKAQVQTLNKNGGGGSTAESPADKKKSDAALAALTRQLEARDTLLAKTQGQYQAANGEVASRTATNLQLTGQVSTLTKQLNTCDTKNAALYKISNQILDAYSQKDDVFGTIANREPFIGFKRVQLQNIVQDDQDSLFDNQVNPSESR